MGEYLPSLIAVVGTLLGACLGFLFQGRLITRQMNETRLDKRREDYIDAATALASAISTLIQAEYNRAKLRIDRIEGEQRNTARQYIYDMRTAARAAAYRLQIVGSPIEDRELPATLDSLIELCRRISAHSTTIEETDKRSAAAKAALATLVSDANKRAREI
ncbi:hypothetical protein GCM10009808_09490 [Microbacterium sediminicola]|uniref:Uncharacterized protein n=1 Tax=Microbacterium sediminicola TaxID=415210 RepID=A0ABN2HW14_9MICO